MSAVHDLDDYEPEPEKPKKEKKEKKKSGDDDEEEETSQVKKDLPDCYKILGIGDGKFEDGFNFTADEIKKAFRKLSLIYHPDKAAQNDIEPEEAEERMKEIQEAYNILQDPELKKILDSDPKKLPKGFDKIPSGEEEGDFFEIYTPYFRKFARWSEVTPVPELGNADTPIEEVDAFYDFWYEFRSWRILLGNPKKEEEDGKEPEEGEYDLDTAEDAYERRWMKTENERERKREKKVHMKTIATLRDLAFKKDPRIAAAKSAEREKVEAEKQARLAAKLKREAEAKAEADKNKTPKELAAEAAAQAKRDEERKKLEDKQQAQSDEKAAAEEQAAKVQAAIQARQRKAKEAKEAAKKKKAGPQSKKKK